MTSGGERPGHLWFVGDKMQFGTFIEVAIGLAMMYAMLALLCTTVTELIATFAKLRSKNLKAAIVQLIDNRDLYLSFYNNGIIRSELEMVAGRKLEEKRPDAIKLEAAPDIQKEEWNGSRPGDDDKPHKHTSYFDSKTFALALIDSLDTSKPVKNVNDAIAIAEKLPQSNIRDILLMALSNAEGKLDTARSSVALWFDGAMDRLSGNYKRQLQQITLLVGLAVATLLNADSIAVTTELWTNNSLRSEIADMATGLTPDLLANRCKPAIPPANQSPADEKKALTDQLDCQINDVRARIDDLKPLPLGWNFKKPHEFGALDVILKIVGLILTALAISLGAPLWFDLMQKMIDIRGAGKKPTTENEKQALATAE